jgi:hypothetical protein
VGTGGTLGGTRIPSPPSENFPNRLRRRWRSVPRATKVLALWVAAFVIVGAGLFLWVTARRGTAVAYDILTQHQSPFGSGLGAAGVLLSSFGFFLAPAIIGALVGAAYVSSSQLSARSIEKRLGEVQAGLRPRRDGGR